MIGIQGRIINIRKPGSSSDSRSVVPRPDTLAPPGNLSGRHILRPHPHLLSQNLWGLEPGNLCFNLVILTKLFRDRKMLTTTDQGKEFQLGEEAGAQRWRQDDDGGLSGRLWESETLRRQHANLTGKDGPDLAHSQHSLVSCQGQSLRPQLVLLDPVCLNHLITMDSAGNKSCDYLKMFMLCLGAY